MTASTINPALQFIQTVGVSGFVSGVQTGMILPPQALKGFNAVGAAIDIYDEAMPHEKSLTELRSLISGYPKRQEEVFALLNKHSHWVDLAVRFAARADAIVNAGVASVVRNFKAPFDLDAQWRWIPPGEFQMGSVDDNPYASDDEKPLRTIMTSGFYMLDHPVTNAEFLAFLKALGGKDVRDIKSKLAGDYQPAVEVTQEEAAAHAKWLGEQLSKQMKVSIIGRLPTEAEWEKAAKGPSGNEFMFPATNKKAHFRAKATRVVNHPDAYANEYGLKDMIGNVWEWTSSPCEEGSSSFVVRGGGSWVYGRPGDFRAAVRGECQPGDRDIEIGFRPVLVPQDSQG